MSEEAKKKEMTPWRLERLSDGSLRCARNEVGDEKAVEYQKVPRPHFAPEEIAAIAELCTVIRDVKPAEVSEVCYDARYNRIARRTVEALVEKDKAERAAK